MKVILTGATGFVGLEVLKQCLQNPSITSVVVLARRELPATVSNNPKLTVKIITDFLSYSDDLISDLRGAEACIWTLGKPLSSDNDILREVCIGYTLAALKALDKAVAPAGKRFRFVYCSGRLAERDQNKPLYFAQDYRRIRGQVENEIVAYGEDNTDTIETFIVRPGVVLTKGMHLSCVAFRVTPSIPVDKVASQMVDLALAGSKRQTWENSRMISERIS